jgi:hypothetical protein
MNRWNTLLPAIALLVWSALAAAQGFVREAPKDVKPAIIEVSATPPLIRLDGKEDRLSPGVRIRDLNNMLVLTGNLAGQKLYTVYRRDPAGFVHEVWLLTADEYRKLGGSSAGDPEGHKRFAELLSLIFAARTGGLLK